MKESDKIAPFLTRFFQEEMMAGRNLSPNTILSYRDALKLRAPEIDFPNHKTCVLTQG